MSGLVLITGATSGIGLELAKLFAQDKYDLILTGTKENSLKKFEEYLKEKFRVNVLTITKDLSKTGSAEEIFSEIKNKKLPVDVLVNNAGFGIYGTLKAYNLDIDIAMVQLNVVSLMTLTKLFLKDMLSHNRGRIMNVASTAAFLPGPSMATYYASKSFVLSFSEAISEEIKKSNVTLTVLCPGPTETNFQTRAGNKKTKLVKSKLAGMMTAEEVAKTGYKSLMKGKRIVIPGFRNKLITQFIRLTPRKLVTFVVNFIHKE